MKEECKLVNKQNHQNVSTKIDNKTVTTTIQMLVFPHKGGKREKLIKSLNKYVKKVLPENLLSRNDYRSKKLGSFAKIKDQAKLEHINGLTSLVRCPGETCSRKGKQEGEFFSSKLNNTFINKMQQYFTLFYHHDIAVESLSGRRNKKYGRFHM